MALLPEITFTPCQWELLRLLAEGLNNSDIAGRMNLAVRTVEKQTSIIYSALGLDWQRVNARVAAARWYWSRKMNRRHYIVEASELPIVVEVRSAP